MANREPNSSINQARAQGANRPNPQPIDRAQASRVEPIVIRQSELDSLPEIANNPNILIRASSQGNLDARRREFDAVINSRGRTFQHEPNVLDQYANVTYHIRWSITDDITGSAISTSSQYQATSKTVIAESGATAAFNITEFELENICAPNDRSKTTMFVSFKMTLKEPYGFSLIDKLYTESRLLQVKNHLTNSSFIEIWFTGYDEDGTIVTPQLHTDLYKLLRVNVTKMDCDITADGTTYHLEGMFDNMYANSDHVEIVGQGVNIGPVETVGQFFQLLEDELNRQQLNLEYDFKKRVEYKINLPRDMASWKFSKAPTSSQRNSGIESKNSLSNPTISIARGMDISTILYFVISMTEDGQKYTAGEQRQPSSAAAPTGRRGNSIQANGMANIIMIHSKSQIIGFDALMNDYIRRITYSFTEYPTARAMIDQQNAAAAQQPAQQNDREITLSQSGRYRKRYEYIYTGRNSDIIKMDVKLEWFWQTGVPMQLGENVYSNFTVPPQLNQNGPGVTSQNQYRAAKSRLLRARTELKSVQDKAKGLSAAEARNLDNQITVAEQAVRSAEQDVQAFGQNARRFQVLWDEQSPGEQSQINADTNTINRVLRVGDRALLRDPTIAQGLRLRSRKNKFLEDVDPVVAELPLPISFRPTTEPVNQISNTGGDGQRAENSGANQGPANLPTGRSLVATVLNDVTSSPYFAEVILDIRGDPYWLGLGNVEEDNVMNRNLQSTLRQKNAAWFLNGDTGFYLTFRTGEEPSEETGFIQFTASSIAFTGLYNVVKIKSLFSGGKFTQTLTAQKDILFLPKVSTNSSSVTNNDISPSASVISSTVRSGVVS